MNAVDPSLAYTNHSCLIKLREKIQEKMARKAQPNERYVFLCFQNPDFTQQHYPYGRPPNGLTDRKYKTAPLPNPSPDFYPGQIPYQSPANLNPVDRHVGNASGIYDFASPAQTQNGTGYEVYKLAAKAVGWSHAYVCIVELDPPWWDNFIGDMWELYYDGGPKDIMKWGKSRFVYERDAKYLCLGTTEIAARDVDSYVMQWVGDHPKYNLAFANCSHLAKDIGALLSNNGGGSEGACGVCVIL